MVELNSYSSGGVIYWFSTALQLNPPAVGWFFQTVPTQIVSPFLLGTVPILSFVLVLPRIWNQTKNDRKS